MHGRLELQLFMADSYSEKNSFARSGLRPCHAQLIEENTIELNSNDAQEFSMPYAPDSTVPFRQMSKVSGLSSGTSAQHEGFEDRLSDVPNGMWDNQHQPVSETVHTNQVPGVERQSKSGTSEQYADAEAQVHFNPQNSQKSVPPIRSGFESLGSNLSIVEGSPDNPLVLSSSALEPFSSASEGRLAENEKDEPSKENRSREAIWNEQVLRQVLEEPPPSFQGRILDVFSSKRREKQRIEKNEIALALAEKTAETDVVMFQRPHSSSDILVSLSGGDVPVIAFDDFQEEQAAEFRKDASTEKGDGQRSSEIGIDRTIPVGGRRLDPDNLSDRASSGGEPRAQHLDADKEQIKKPRSSFLHPNSHEAESESESEKDVLKISAPRSWLWSRKVQRPKFLLASDSAAGTCEEPETPKSIQSDAAVGYELFLQEAEMATSPRSRLCRPASQPEGFLDF